jgi:hypothetical protein
MTCHWASHVRVAKHWHVTDRPSVCGVPTQAFTDNSADNIEAAHKRAKILRQGDSSQLDLVNTMEEELHNNHLSFYTVHRGTGIAESAWDGDPKQGAISDLAIIRSTWAHHLHRSAVRLCLEVSFFCWQRMQG